MPGTWQALVDAMRSGWTGEAADAATQSLNPLIVNFHEGGQDLAAAQDLVSRQVESWHTAKNAVQPMPPKPVVQDPLIGAARQTFVSQVQGYTSAAQSNVDAMSVYGDASTYNTSNLPPLDPTLRPPGGSVTVRPSAAAQTGVAATRAGSATGVSGGGSPAVGAAVGSEPGVAGPTSDTGSRGVATGGGPRVVSPTVGSGTTSLSSAMPAASAPASELPGGGVATPPGSGPVPGGDFRGSGGYPGVGGRSGEELRDGGAGQRGPWRVPGQESLDGAPLGGRSGGPADGEDTPGGGIRGGQPGDAAGLGDGEPAGPGAGARSGAGAAALEEPARGFGAASTAGERGPVGAPGMVAGRGGGDESEGEHTNRYVRGDPRELFVGELPLVAPPTIGPPAPPLPAPQQER